MATLFDGVVVVVVVSHIQFIGCQPEKLIYTVAKPARGLLNREKNKALHGRLAGRFKPPLAGRCNDFAPSRQKNCHRQKQPSRPGP